MKRLEEERYVCEGKEYEICQNEGKMEEIEKEGFIQL